MDGSEGGDPVEGLSFSNSLSKGSVYESDSICSAYLDDAASRVADGVRPASISNEEIHKGDDIIQTYRVEDDAIHGGMGSVWRVHHQSWNTDLAMKRPQPRFFAEGSDSRKADFVAECEHWINLGLHPNIVSCYYVRDIGGVPTIFSEWMEGGSLKDAIQSGRLYEGSEDEIHARILDNAIQTMRGLMYSHENGLIHQDVKPGNILLTRDWEAKVADFGLAKAQSRLTDGEKPLSSGYTLAYCPKEQAEGAEAAVWMDVYAWALTVLEMYLGSHPWQTGAEAAVQAEALMGRCRIAAPEAVRGLLLRCLREPEDGFDSVTGELAEIYRGVTGAEYPRPDAKAVMDTADALNNRALSFIDLGLADVAEALWRQALENAPNHLHTLYNQGLYLWRKGEIDDEEVMRRCMTAQTGAQPELEAAWYDRICGERGVREDALFGESETIKTWRGVGKAYPAKGRFSRDQQRLWLHVSRLPEEGETTNQYGSVNELWCLDTRDWSRIYMIPGAYYFRLSDDEEFILYILSNPKVLFAARADTGERLYTMRCDKEIKGCALEPNGSRVIIQSENTIQLWNMVSGEMLREAESKPRHQFTRGSFGDDWRFTDGGKYFVQMNNANYLKWTMELLKLEVFAKIDPSGEKCFYRDGLRAVSVPAGEFHFYDCTQVVENNSFGKEKTRLVPRERVRLDGRETRLLTLAGNDTRILAAAPKGQLKLYDEEMRHCLCTFFGHNRRVYDACATDDLSMIVSVSQDDDGTVRIFKGRGQTVKAPWELCLARSFDEARQREEALQAHAAKVEALIEAGELAGAVQALAEAEAQEGAEDSVRLRALRRRLTGLLVPRALESVVENGGFRPDPDRDSVARCVAADPLDRFLAVSSGYSWQHPFYGLWNMDFTPLRALDEDDSPDVLLFSKSGRWLAAAFNDCVLISDIQTRETRRVGIEKRINPNGDLRVDFSDDGHTLLVGRDGDTCGALIDTETGKIKRKYRFEDTYTDYRLSADGTRVYAASYYGTLRELDASDGRVLREVELDAEIGAMTRSPDGKRLYISVHLKDEIIVWDVPSWREVRRFKCDLGKSINARIDASNRLMALFGDTAGGAIAQKIQLRSLPDCRVVAEVETASETVTEVAFSQDGCAMYASCARMVRAWELRWRLDPLDDAEDGEPEEEPPRKAISEADQRELESLQKALKDAEARVESGRVAYEKADARYNTPEREQMSREIEEKRREISRLGFFGRAKKKRLLAEEALLERKVADLFIERREAKEKLEAAQQAAEAARQTLETFRKRIFGGE